MAITNEVCPLCGERHGVSDKCLAPGPIVLDVEGNKRRESEARLRHDKWLSEESNRREREVVERQVRMAALDAAARVVSVVSPVEREAIGTSDLTIMIAKQFARYIETGET